MGTSFLIGERSGKVRLESKPASFEERSPPSLSLPICSLVLSSSKSKGRPTGEKPVTSPVGDRPKLRFGEDRRLCIGEARNTCGGDGGDIESSSSMTSSSPACLVADRATVGTCTDTEFSGGSGRDGTGGSGGAVSG